MPDLNPIHWLLAGAIILALGSLGYGKVQSMRLEASEGQFRAFKAETESQASMQALANWKEAARRDGITRKLELDNVKLQNDLDRKYVEYNRMRHTKAGSSRVPNLSSATKIIAKFDDAARLARSLERLESGIIERLAKTRDEAINRTITCKSWLDAQSNGTYGQQLIVDK